MKKIISLVMACLSFSCLLPTANSKTAVALEANPVPLSAPVTTTATENTESGFITPSVSDPRNEDGKHFILNEDGSYGGSLFDLKYGKGAPLNGELDIENSPYYLVNDFYNMPSTEYRTLYPHFSPYQQTMQDSSGLACLLMVLNYLGEDVKTQYSELALVEKYEEVNDTIVYGNGTTVSGLINLVNSLNLGYTATKEGFTGASNPDSSTGRTENLKRFKTFINGCLEEGKFVLIRWQAPKDYGWKLVIGYDDVGMVRNTMTDEVVSATSEDVLIMAEPYDVSDHCQDGYATASVRNFVPWWVDMSLNATVNTRYDYVVIDPNIDMVYEREEVDQTVKQQLYDIHLPRNPEGSKCSYGGTRNQSLYGSISTGDGSYNHTNAYYYKINDFYNMGNAGTRLLLKNYTVLQQTMGSSCGVCAVNSVMKYYGYNEESYYDLELSYVKLYEKLVNDTIKGKGTSVTGQAKTLKTLGYKAYPYEVAQGNTPRFTTYEQYAEFMKYHLKNGRPIVLSTKTAGGHFITVIGFDDMGTANPYDDIMIMADSNDISDHYQDGYTINSATRIFRQHVNSYRAKIQQMLVVYDKD